MKADLYKTVYKTQEEYNEEILQNRRKSQSLLGTNIDITV